MRNGQTVKKTILGAFQVGDILKNQITTADVLQYREKASGRLGLNEVPTQEKETEDLDGDAEENLDQESGESKEEPKLQTYKYKANGQDFEFSVQNK